MSPPTMRSPGARLSMATITLRPAGAADSQLIWTWRNDPATRAASFHSAPIPWEHHVRWFADALARTERKLYVIEVDGQPVGAARLDIAESEAAVSIHLARQWQGCGIGPAALHRVAEIAFEELGLDRLLASVKADNPASLSAFAKAAFHETTREAGVVTLARGRRGRR